MNQVTAAYLRSQAHVYFKGSEKEFHYCGSIVSATILRALSLGKRSLRWSLWSSIDNTAPLECDFQRMKLVNPNDGEEEDIFIEFRWDPKSLVSIVSKKQDRTLRRQVIIMALDRIRSQQSLRKILTRKGLPTCLIRENPYLCPGHPPHDNFVESLLDFFENKTVDGSIQPTLFERFLENAADDAGVESFDAIERGGIRTVFHGTDHAAMDSILQSGLDPNCRRDGLTEDYFGASFPISLRYTKEKTKPAPTIFKLLVFIVLNPVVGSSSPQHWTIASNKFELPIAEIKLDVSD